jgi:hypothetical protein
MGRVRKVSEMTRRFLFRPADIAPRWISLWKPVTESQEESAYHQCPREKPLKGILLLSAVPYPSISDFYSPKVLVREDTVSSL